MNKTECKKILEVLNSLIKADRQTMDYFIEASDKGEVYFVVSREKATGTYYYNLLKEDKAHLKKAYKEFRYFMKHLYYEGASGAMIKNALHNYTPIKIKNIYDFKGTLTSSDESIEDLFAKFELVYKALGK